MQVLMLVASLETLSQNCWWDGTSSVLSTLSLEAMLILTPREENHGYLGNSLLCYCFETHEIQVAATSIQLLSTFKKTFNH